jgi:tRNA1Val (adenine37-N6)-methyltransferase
LSSSVNPYYTFQYSQPDAYRFSHDSVFLARRAFELVRDSDLSRARVLDLCAGCGVVGLDFLFHLRDAGLALPRHVDFLEVQEIYGSHFAANAAAFSNAHFLAGNYADLSGTYDLILCNPPFFRVGQGALSPNEFKNRCRFFIDSDFASLFLAIGRVLRGQAYVLLRGLDDHGIDVEAEVRVLLPGFGIERLGQVRGTGLIRITC